MTANQYWEERLEALQGLAECSLHMRGPGNWYLSTHMEIGGNGLLKGVCGNGADPKEAVLDAWKIAVTELKGTEFLVVNAMSDNRREVRWNGFMWKDTPK